MFSKNKRLFIWLLWLVLGGIVVAVLYELQFPSNNSAKPLPVLAFAGDIVIFIYIAMKQRSFSSYLLAILRILFVGAVFILWVSQMPFIASNGLLLALGLQLSVEEIFHRTGGPSKKANVVSGMDWR